MKIFKLVFEIINRLSINEKMLLKILQYEKFQKNHCVIVNAPIVVAFISNFSQKTSLSEIIKRIFAYLYPHTALVVQLEYSKIGCICQQFLRLTLKGHGDEETKLSLLQQPNDLYRSARGLATVYSTHTIYCRFRQMLNIGYLATISVHTLLADDPQVVFQLHQL